MPSPFLLLEKLSITRYLMEVEYQKRAKQIVKRISPFIKTRDKVLDIGTGTGFVARGIIKAGVKNVTCVDVRLNHMNKQLPVTLYDGNKLPFGDTSFDTALLIAVLHHCKNPLQVLDEAQRVTSKRIIIMEDLFESNIEKWLTLIEDSIVNWEFKGHPHSNKTEAGWLKVFAKRNLSVVHFEKFRLVCAGFPFRLGVFVLEKSKSQPGKKRKKGKTKRASKYNA